MYVVYMVVFENNHVFTTVQISLRALPMPLVPTRSHLPVSPAHVPPVRVPPVRVSHVRVTLALVPEGIREKTFKKSGLRE